MSDYLLRTARRMRDTGNLAEAARMYGEILRLEPQQSEALEALGFYCYGAARFDQAAEFLSQAVAINPQSPDAWFTLGCALQKLNRLNDAVLAYDQSAALKPASADAFVNRGVALLALKRPDEALASFDAAIAANADEVRALINRGSALEALGRTEEALTAFGDALARVPNSAEALINRGSTLFNLKRPGEAAADYEKAYALNPAVPYLLGNLVLYRLHACDWRHYDAGLIAIAKSVREGKPAVQPFVHVTVSRSPAEQLQCARLAIARDAPAPPVALWRGERYAHQKLRIGYLSADFREHAVARLAAGVFEEHDRSRFDFEAFSLLSPSETESPMRNRIEDAFGIIHDIDRVSDAEAAVLLRQREIDIAVDLTGFTTGGRPGILSFRPAPIQANFLGYAGTMGARFYDYIIADGIVIPDEQRNTYAEKVVTLPHAYQCNDDKRTVAQDPPTRAECGLPAAGFVFCCFNNNNKIAPDIFSLWMRILQRVPDSVLWLLEDSADASRNLRREAVARGIAADRLIFAKRVRAAEHLARQRLADLFLDTLPYNAHTTASDALWVGLPVLTMMGTTFAGRVAASLLTAIGVPELIARFAGEYENMAVRCAEDKAGIAALKAKIEANRRTHPLFDTKRFARNLEAAYTKMWERHLSGQKPDHLIIADSPR